jgi:hypothetical protein
MERFTSVFAVEDLEGPVTGLLFLLASCILGSWPLEPFPVISCLNRETGID